MPLHDFPLIQREVARLEQDFVGDAYFSYVVHWAREKDLIHKLIIQAEHPGKPAAVIADALNMSTGVYIPIFRRTCHRKNGFKIAYLKVGGPFVHTLFQYVVVFVQFLVQQAHFQHVVNARQHLGQFKRLANEIPRAGLKSAQLVARLGGDDQHRKVALRFNFLEPLHHLESVQDWHLQIEQDQVVVILEVKFADLGRISGGHDGIIAGTAQYPLE